MHISEFLQPGQTCVTSTWKTQNILCCSNRYPSLLASMWWFSELLAALIVWLFLHVFMFLCKYMKSSCCNLSSWLLLHNYSWGLPILFHTIKVIHFFFLLWGWYVFTYPVDKYLSRFHMKLWWIELLWMC